MPRSAMVRTWHRPSHVRHGVIGSTVLVVAKDSERIERVYAPPRGAMLRAWQSSTHIATPRPLLPFLADREGVDGVGTFPHLHGLGSSAQGRLRGTVAPPAATREGHIMATQRFVQQGTRPHGASCPRNAVAAGANCRKRTRTVPCDARGRSPATLLLSVY